MAECETNLVEYTPSQLLLLRIVLGGALECTEAFTTKIVSSRGSDHTWPGHGPYRHAIYVPHLVSMLLPSLPMSSGFKLTTATELRLEGLSGVRPYMIDDDVPSNDPRSTIGRASYCVGARTTRGNQRLEERQIIPEEHRSNILQTKGTRRRRVLALQSQ